tara:strand:+ start:673 stop:1302 length:630 start_codon:yes stop_codon:yes gene_type:complete
MKDLWNNYKALVHEKIIKDVHAREWAHWEGKGTTLVANHYYPKYHMKSRACDIYSDKTNIYNNILYPKTGCNLPCFGMDLMGFFAKKVIIVFDFQHPKENHLVSVPGLPKAEGEFRFFEPGNHFSENVYVAKCTADEVDDHLPMFEKYLDAYVDMLDTAQPVGNDWRVYSDFDKYMTKLDPVAGYLSSKFGKEKSEDFVENFLFSYASD